MTAAPPIRTLEEFLADPEATFAELARSGEPIALTIGGVVRGLLSPPQIEAVGESEEERQFVDSVLESERHLREHGGRDALEFFAEIRAKHGI